MNDNIDNKEWINEYQTLKQVNPANPFVVPVNYFEEVEEQIMSVINLDILNTLPDNGFVVPQGYFEHLDQDIQSRIAVEEMLTFKQAFTIPENYFEQLEGNILSRIAVEELINTKEAFTVPENYFDELGHNIHSRIAVEEALNQADGFAVPEGYFDALEDKILLQTLKAAKKDERKQRQAVVIKLWTTAAFKYATAACFALIIGGAVFISEFRSASTKPNVLYLHKELSKIPNDEIESYLQLNSDVPALLENTDPDSNTLQPLSDSVQQKN